MLILRKGMEELNIIVMCNLGVDLKPDLLTPQPGLLTPSAVGRRKKRQTATDTVTYDLNYNAPAVSASYL